MNELKEIMGICIKTLGRKGYIANRYSGQPNTFFIENIKANIAVNFSYNIPDKGYEPSVTAESITEICREALEEAGYETTLYGDHGMFSVEAGDEDIYIYAE